MLRRPYSPDEVAQARTIVTRFDTILAENGHAEAGELRQTAWAILLADKAARVIQSRCAWARPSCPSGDAA